MLGALDGLTDEVLVDFFVDDVLDFEVAWLLGLLAEDDFFLVFVALEPVVSEAVWATLWVTGKASSAHNNGASKTQRGDINDKKRIPVALENIKTM